MTSVTNFDPAHVSEMKNFAKQDHLVQLADPNYTKMLQSVGPAWTVRNVAGEVLICFGFVPVNRWRGQAWGLLQKTKPADFIAVHRVVKRAIKDSTFDIMETYVNPIEPPAMRWVKLLGFRVTNAYKPLFFLDGSGAVEWSWFRSEHPCR